MSIIKTPEEIDLIMHNDNKIVNTKNETTLVSRSRMFLFNVKTLGFSLTIMFLTGMIYLVKQSILDTEFLENIAENIQNKIYNRFTFNSNERNNICNNNIIPNLTVFEQLNISSYYDTFIKWREAICS